MQLSSVSLYLIGLPSSPSFKKYILKKFVNMNGIYDKPRTCSSPVIGSREGRGTSPSQSYRTGELHVRMYIPAGRKSWANFHEHRDRSWECGFDIHPSFPYFLFLHS